MTDRQRLLEKRAKLAALAERGVDGERDNARRMLAAFDRKHPCVRERPAVSSAVAFDAMMAMFLKVSFGEFFHHRGRRTKGRPPK